MTRTKSRTRSNTGPRLPWLLLTALAAVGLTHALGLTGVGAAALMFTFWLSCVLSWGLLLSGTLGFATGLRDTQEALAPLALGSAAAALVLAALGQLGLVGVNATIPLQLLLLAGPTLDAWLGTKRPVPAVETAARSERFLIPAAQAALLATLVLMALAAATPQGHPDPLYYNLLGPRLWFQAGAIHVPETMPILYQCSYWEALLLWGQCLLGGPRGAGLVEAQLFGQWAHVFLGVGGCILALRTFLAPYARSRAWLWLAVVGAATSASMTWTAWFAKNDWGASFWLLAGFAQAVNAKGHRSRTVVAGALVGLGLAAKLTIAFAAVPLLALLIVSRTADLDLFCAGAVAPLAALFLRNALGTGNPFFPTMDRFFPSALLTASWRSYLKGFEGSGLDLDGALWWGRARLLFAQTPLVLVVLAAPLSWLRPAKGARLRPLWLTTMAGLLLFLAFAGPAASLRLFGPGVLLLGAVTVLSIEELLTTYGRGRAAAATGVALATLALSVCFAGLPWRAALGHYNSYSFIGEDARAWLRAHAGPGDAILLPDDNRLYDLSYLNVRSVAEDPALQRLFTPLQSLEQELAALRRLDIRYVLLMQSWKDTAPSRLFKRLEELAAREPRRVVFSEPDARVLDLH